MQKCSAFDPFKGRKAELELCASLGNVHDFLDYNAVHLPLTGGFHAESMHSVRARFSNFLEVPDRAHTRFRWISTRKPARGLKAIFVTFEMQRSTTHLLSWMKFNPPSTAWYGDFQIFWKCNEVD